jgi:hypothetical protein
MSYYDYKGDEKEVGLSDELFEAYCETTDCTDWIAENCGGQDWVEYIESNYDMIYDMAVEYYNNLTAYNPADEF